MPQANRIITTSLTTVAALSLSPAALAQAGDDSTPSPEEQNSVRWTVSPEFQYQFSTGLDHSNGDFRVFRGGLNARADWAATDNVSLSFLFGYEYNRYDFGRPNTFLAGTNDPFSDIHILDLGVTANFKIDEQWSWFAGARTRFAGESGVDLGDAAAFGGLGGVTYAFDEGRSIGIGILAGTQIEDNAIVVPLINVDWRFNDQWRFSSRGTSGEFIYALDDQSEIGFGAAWEYRRFRLDDSAPQLSAVVQDTSIPLFVRFTHKPSDAVTISLTGGVSIWQKFEVSDRNGNNTRDFDADPSPFVGLNVGITF